MSKKMSARLRMDSVMHLRRRKGIQKAGDVGRLLQYG